MAGGRGRDLVVVLAMVLVSVVVMMRPVEAGFGSGGMYHEDAVDEFMDEPTRRMLATKTYISYGALNGNRAPCPSSSAGRSYYTAGCANTGPASPYQRNCGAITRCARG